MKTISHHVIPTINTIIIKWAPSMTDMTTDKWINIEEAAEYLGVKPATIRDWIRKEKDIPAKKIGKQWKFKRSKLNQWVQSGKAEL